MDKRFCEILEKCKQGGNRTKLQINMMMIELKDEYDRLCVMNENIDAENEKMARLELTRYEEIETLKYHLNYLEREIGIMQDFSPKYSIDEIGLLPLDEYFHQFPDQKSVSDDKKLMVNRLNYELVARRQLSEQINALRTEYDVLQRKNDEKRAYIQTLKDSAKTLIGASGPLQKLFSSSISETIQKQEIVRNLPKPLYILYVTLDFHRNIDVGMDLTIEGDVDSAKAYWKRDVMDEENSSKKQKVDIELFPLSVQLVVDSAKLRFYYLPEYKIVTVSSNLALEHLFVDDNGRCTPDTNVLTDMDFSTFDYGLAFRWAQWMCGSYTFEGVTNEK